MLRGAKERKSAVLDSLFRLGRDVLAVEMAEVELEAIVERIRTSDDGAVVEVVADLVELAGDFNASLPLRLRLRALGVDSPRLARALGIACLEAGDADHGVEHLRQAVAVLPDLYDEDTTAAVEAYGVGLLEVGHLDLALVNLKRALDMHRDGDRGGTVVEARTLHNMGVALRRKKAPRLAKAQLKKALEIREANLSQTSSAVNSRPPAPRSRVRGPRVSLSRVFRDRTAPTPSRTVTSTSPGRDSASRT